MRVLLQCEDQYFVQAFSNYASDKCCNIDFVCFTTADKAVEYIGNSHPRLDAVLAEQEVLDQLRAPGTVRLLVSDHTSFAAGGQVQINIYQSGSAILGDIRNALALAGAGSFHTVGERTVHVVCSYSVQGGSGKTVLSYALAAAAVRSGKQALYVNLEPFPALTQLYSEEQGRSMDALLLTLKSGRELAPVVLDTMLRNQDGVMVLPAFSFAQDMLSLTEEQLKKLIRTLVEKTEMEYVFIDLPVGIYPLNLWAMEQCSTVLQVYTDDPVGREHLRRAESDMYFRDLPISGTRLTVLNRCREKTGEPEVSARIPYSDSLNRGCRVTEVQEKNPEFLRSCTELLEKII